MPINDDDDEPRPRKKRVYHDEDDDYDDDEAPRRKRDKRGSKTTSGVSGLVIGLVIGGGVLLLLVCGGGIVAVYLMGRSPTPAGPQVNQGLPPIQPVGQGGGAVNNDAVNNAAVTQANFDKVQLDMPLQDVEAVLGRGQECGLQEAQALMKSAPGNIPAIGNNPQQLGITKWYRWKNGPLTVLVGVDAATKVHVAGRVTVTGNSHSSSWKSGGSVGRGK